MTADHSPDPGRQRTVAELLQQYGDGRGDMPRRRRRAEQPDGAEAADPVDSPEIGPALGEVDPPGGRSGGFSAGYGPPTSRWDELGARGGLFPDPASPPPAPSIQAVPEQRWGSGAGPGRSVDPLTGEPVDPPPGGVDASPTGGYPFPVAPPYPPGSTYSPHSPPVESPYQAGRSPAPPPDPPTETLPRYPGARGDSAALNGPSTLDGGPATGQVSRAELFGDDPDDPDPEGPPPADMPSWAGPAGLADVREAEQAVGAEPIGVAGWAAMVGQWVLGGIGGAALWVGFRYLWLTFPVIALVAAVVVTVALVLLVRAIRRSDDLQTTMLAVLVGLVVTVSPAVLLLAVR